MRNGLAGLRDTPGYNTESLATAQTGFGEYLAAIQHTLSYQDFRASYTTAAQSVYGSALDSPPVAQVQEFEIREYTNFLILSPSDRLNDVYVSLSPPQWARYDQGFATQMWVPHGDFVVRGAMDGSRIIQIPPMRQRRLYVYIVPPNTVDLNTTNPYTDTVRVGFGYNPGANDFLASLVAGLEAAAAGRERRRIDG